MDCICAKYENDFSAKKMRSRPSSGATPLNKKLLTKPAVPILYLSKTKIGRTDPPLIIFLGCPPNIAIKRGQTIKIRKGYANCKKLRPFLPITSANSLQQK
jgi:hypothetical protein